MKTAISIPDSLFTAADQLAKRLGISRSELYQRAVSLFIKANKNTGITEALNNVYANGDIDQGLDPLLDILQGASIAREEW